MKENISDLIKQAGALQSDLYQKNFLLTWDKSDHDIEQIMLVAEILKLMRKQNISTRCFDSGLAVSQFRDRSLRTRFTFASAANMLGLDVQNIEEEKTPFSNRETVRELANIISYTTEVIGIRDDMFLGEGHTYINEFAQAVEQSHKSGILPHLPGVLSLQCDIDHPSQSIADLLHLKNHFGSLQDLRGKKIAVTWAYSPTFGKPLSVPQGTITLLSRLGMDIELAHPQGFELTPEAIALARENSQKSGGSFQISDSMESAFTNADIVYPKSWAPALIMERRSELLRRTDYLGIENLEDESIEISQEFANWECNQDMMKRTKNARALYMHCLPADISGITCEKGEVTQDVFDRYHAQTYAQVGNKAYVIAAIILSNRFKDVPGLLTKFLERGTKRVGW